MCRDPDDEEFGLERLRKTVVEIGDLPIDDMIPRLYATIEAFARGRPQDDDVTAVIVRRLKIT